MYASKTKSVGAWICSNENGRQTRGRQKIYQPGSKIYLNNGDEFEIELHNPTTDNVKAEIKIDDKHISRGGIILRPGERMYLECFPDSKKKFTFRTYEVEDTNESRNAIRNNGRVEIKFYKEKKIIPYCNPCPYYVYYPSGCTYPTYYDIYNTSFGTTAGNVNVGHTLTNTDSSVYTFKLNSDTNFSSNFTLTSASMDMMETGQVEGGSRSDQEFEMVDMSFESYSFKTYSFHILPMSQKPLDKKAFKKSKKKKGSSTSNKLDELIKLKDLFESDLITKEEFDKLKSELI